jgi:nucleoid-associated protein YgaU
MWVPPVTFEQVAYSLYMVVAGDRLDTLAYNIYGDANLWWHIADANPQINYPGPLAPGQMIRIPN